MENLGCHYVSEIQFLSLTGKSPCKQSLFLRYMCSTRWVVESDTNVKEAFLHTSIFDVTNKVEGRLKKLQNTVLIISSEYM